MANCRINRFHLCRLGSGSDRENWWDDLCGCDMEEALHSLRSTSILHIKRDAGWHFLFLQDTKWLVCNQSTIAEIETMKICIAETNSIQHDCWIQSGWEMDVVASIIFQETSIGGLQYLVVLLTAVALLAVIHEENLGKNVFSLATHAIPKSDAALHRRPSVFFLLIKSKHASVKSQVAK